MSTLELIWYISIHPAAFGFWSSLPPDNIALNPANKKTEQTGIGFTAHATLDMEQLISHTRTAIVDTLPLSRILIGE